jgi:hypothetical protein
MAGIDGIFTDEANSPRKVTALMIHNGGAPPHRVGRLINGVASSADLSNQARGKCRTIFPKWEFAFIRSNAAAASSIS